MQQIDKQNAYLNKPDIKIILSYLRNYKFSHACIKLANMGKCARKVAFPCYASRITLQENKAQEAQQYSHNTFREKIKKERKTKEYLTFHFFSKLKVANVCKNFNVLIAFERQLSTWQNGYVPLGF